MIGASEANKFTLLVIKLKALFYCCGRYVKGSKECLRKLCHVSKISRIDVRNDNYKNGRGNLGGLSRVMRPTHLTGFSTWYLDFR